MQVSECSFSGIPKCLQLSGDGIELIVTLSFGPRIISCRLNGGENLFRVFDHLTDADPCKWNIYGGHRLWIAPEIPERTKVPDNREATYSVVDGKSSLKPLKNLKTISSSVFPLLSKRAKSN